MGVKLRKHYFTGVMLSNGFPRQKRRPKHLPHSRFDLSALSFFSVYRPYSPKRGNTSKMNSPFKMRPNSIGNLLDLLWKELYDYGQNDLFGEST